MSDDDTGINARLAVSLSADISQLRKAFEQAGKAADGALLGIEQRGQRTKERLERNLELIKLTQQLDVARTGGNIRTVERLSEEILLRKTINTLIGQGVKGEEARAAAEAHVAALSAASAGREGLLGAGRAVFDRSRLAVFEEGGAKIGIYGGALEKLGAAGLVAAGGLAAVGIAAEMANKAAEYAEEISNTADKLGVTTKALQEYNLVAIASGISTDTLKEALEKGNAAIGALQSGVGGERMKKAFDGLKIDPAEAKGWNNILDALPTIAEKINGLGTVAEKTQIAKRLGIEGILPIILKGKDAIEELRAEAEATGAVMDTDMIAKGKKAAEAMKEVSHEADVNLKRAFIELAPFIERCVTLVSQMAKGIADAVEAFGPISSFSRVHIESAKQDVARGMQTDRQLGVNVDPKTGSAINELQGTPLQRFNLPAANYNKLKGRMDELNAREKELDALDAAASKKASGVAGPPLVVAKAKKEKADRDDTGLITGADTALDEAKRGLAEALAKQSTDLTDKANAETAGNFADLQKQTDDLAHKELEIDKAISQTKDGKKIAALRAAEGALEEAAVQDGLTRVAKDELVERQKVVGIISQVAAAGAQESQLRQEGLKRQEDQFTAMAKLARTTEARNSFERDALAAAQAREREAAQAAVDKATSELAIATTNKNPADILTGLRSLAGASSAQAALPAQQSLQNQALANKQLSPWDKWVKEGEDASADVSQSLQTYAVKSMNSFNESIAQSIVSGKGMKSVFQNIFKEMETSLISYLLKQAEIGAFGGGATTGGAGGMGSILGTIAGFAKFIPGFAGGTDNAPGGVADVGEHGPERVFLPKGSKVVPNNVLSALNSSATKAMEVSSTHFYEGPQFTFQNPVVTQDILDQANAYAARRASDAAVAGAMGGHQMTMAKLASHSRNRLR